MRDITNTEAVYLNLKSINRKFRFEKAYMELFYLLIFFLPVFLLANRFAYLYVLNIILLIFTSIAALIFKRKLNRFHMPVAGLLFVIYFYFILSYFLSGQTLSNFISFDFLRYDGGFFFCYLPFFIFLVPYFDYEKITDFYFNVLFLSFSLFAIFGLFEYLSGNHFLMIRTDDIYVGPMFVAINNSHNATGAVYCMVCIFALAFFLMSDRFGKIAYGGIFLLNFIALFLTKSRGSLVGFVIGAVFILFITSKSLLKFFRNILILAIGAVPLVFVTNSYGRILEIFRRTDLNSLTRLVLWDRALYLFKQSPATGVGFGRFNDIIWHYDVVPLSGNCLSLNVLSS